MHHWGWSKDPGPTYKAGRLSRHFFCNMKECLSIFVDESGDFGTYCPQAPYYIVTMLFHDQSTDISPQIQKLDEEIQRLGYEKDFVIHTAPLIRREEMFFNELPNQRRALLTKLFYFVLKSDIQYRTFVFEKRQFEDSFKLEGRIAKEMSQFIRANLYFFQSFSNVILYYDNGQYELNRILNAVLTTELSRYEARKVLPKDYKLFQAADLICTLQLLSLKAERDELSHSELLIFHSIRDLKKQFLKPIQRKLFNQ